MRTFNNDDLFLVLNGKVVLVDKNLGNFQEGDRYGNAIVVSVECLKRAGKESLIIGEIVCSGCLKYIREGGILFVHTMNGAIYADRMCTQCADEFLAK